MPVLRSKVGLERGRRMMISAYDGKRAYNSRYIRSIQLRRGGGGAEMKIAADIDGVKGVTILYRANIYENQEAEECIERVYKRLIDRINEEKL